MRNGQVCPTKAGQRIAFDVFKVVDRACKNGIPVAVSWKAAITVWRISHRLVPDPTFDDEVGGTGIDKAIRLRHAFPYLFERAKQAIARIAHLGHLLTAC